MAKEEEEVGTYQLQAVAWDEDTTGLYRINTKNGKVEVLNRNELSPDYLQWTNVSDAD